MAHYAKVVDSKVVEVRVMDDDFIANEFVDSSPGDWIKTSFNTRGGVHYDPETGEPSADQSKALRGKFAGIGDNYNWEDDYFYPDAPYDSWVFSTEDYRWHAPIAAPDDGELYAWNEEAYQADNTAGWEQMTEIQAEAPGYSEE